VIRELRRRHLALAGGLALAAPGLVALALGARPPAGPVESPLPQPILPGARPVELAPAFPLRVAARADSAAGVIRFVLEAPAPLRAPDPVLYWSPSPPDASGAPPTGAVPIGAVGYGRATSAEVALSRLSASGHFLLVSLPAGRLLATSPGTLP
jgi:hypothetical protein